MTADLTTFYNLIQDTGYMRSNEHAARWTQATLQMLGVNLDRKTKRALAKALPESLARDLNGVFWLLHFRDSDLSAIEFQNRVARRAGASDKFRARSAIIAVFSALKQYIDDDLDKQVAETLSPEVRALWQTQP
jgi:uncharacterized protein (DUF2267 family)